MEKYVGRKVRLYQGDGTYPRGDAPVDQRARLRDQRPDPHGPLRPPRLARAAREPRLQADAPLAPAQPDARGRSASRPRISPAGSPGRPTTSWCINAADTRADLTGWVTIDNKSGATYGNAALKLVAGRRQPGAGPRAATRACSRWPPRRRDRPPRAATSRPRASSSTTSTRSTAARRSRTTRPSSSRSSSASDVPVDEGAHLLRRRGLLPQRVRRADVEPEGRRCTSRSKNSKANRLGLPLPKGKVRVYKADASGSQQFIGEDWIDHTPMDERVKIKMGEAFDVVGERMQKDFKKLGGKPLRGRVGHHRCRNHKKEDASRSRSSSPCPGTGRC